MIDYCQECNQETKQTFVGINTDNELHLFECNACNERYEVSKDHVKSNQEYREINS